MVGNSDRDEFSVENILEEIDKKRNIRCELEADEEASLLFLNNKIEYNAPSSARRFYISLYDWLDTIIKSIVFAFVVVIFFFRINEVYGVSMQNTLNEGDRLIIQQCFYTPSYGDIVAIQADNLPNQITGEIGELIVKRIVGLAGDVINIDAETGCVYRNSREISEAYITEMIDKEHLGNITYPFTVPENCVFVLGDNRNHSTDSRYDNNGAGNYVGSINENYIIGKAVLRFWPLENFGGLK